MTHRPILIIGLLALAACNGDDGSAASSTTAASTSTSSPTSIASTVPQTTPATAASSPPTTSTTGTTLAMTAPPTTVPPTTTSPGAADWRSIVETLGQRRQALYAAPDVALISSVCGSDSPCAQQLDVQIADLASKGWRVEGADPFVVVEARVDEFDGDTIDDSLLVTVVAVIKRLDNAGTIVDASGATVAAVEPDTEPGFNAQGRFLLGRVGPPEDPWRLISQDALPEVPA